MTRGGKDGGIRPSPLAARTHAPQLGVESLSREAAMRRTYGVVVFGRVDSEAGVGVPGVQIRIGYNPTDS